MTFTDMIVNLMNLRTNAQILHWQTRSYATHKATDELLEDLTKKTDELVEIIQGMTNERLHFSTRRPCTLRYKNMTKTGFIRHLERTEAQLGRFINQLDQLDQDAVMGATNVRDELIATLQKTRYLLSFDTI